MPGDPGEDIGKPRLRIDIIEPAGLNEGVEDGSALSAPIRAAEQPCLAAERHGSKDMGLDPPVERRQHGGGCANLIGERRETQRHAFSGEALGVSRHRF